MISNELKLKLYNLDDWPLLVQNLSVFASTYSLLYIVHHIYNIIHMKKYKSDKIVFIF